MTGLESDFHCSEDGIVRQTELEAQTAEIARRLEDSVERLKWLCCPESSSGVRSIQSQAATLNRYCSAMSGAICDMLTELRGINRSVDTILDHSYFELREIIRSISKD